MNKVPTPLRAIRSWCLGCVESAAEVRTCGGERVLNGGADEQGRCLFFPHRLGRGRPSVKLIRKMCLWCQGNQAQLVRECHEGDCPLWPYRMGRNPNYSPEIALNLAGAPRKGSWRGDSGSNSHEPKPPHTSVRVGEEESQIDKKSQREGG